MVSTSAANLRGSAMSAMNARSRFAKGQIVALFTIILPVLLGVMALGADFSIIYFNWSMVQKAADAAALAGASQLTGVSGSAGTRSTGRSELRKRLRVHERRQRPCSDLSSAVHGDHSPWWVHGQDSVHNVTGHSGLRRHQAHGSIFLRQDDRTKHGRGRCEGDCSDKGAVHAHLGNVPDRASMHWHLQYPHSRSGSDCYVRVEIRGRLGAG